MSADQSHEHADAIVGFEITGDPLLGGEFIPFRRGLTVLYGLNGAGKSRLLRGISGTLLGVASDVEVGMVVRATSGPVADALAQAIMPGHLRRELNASEVVEQLIRDRAGSRNPALTAELLNSRLFLIMPTGTTAHPSWDAWPVADLSHPIVASEFQQVTDLALDFEQNSPDDQDEWDQAFEDYQEQVSQHVLSADDPAPTARRHLRRAQSEHFATYNVQDNLEFTPAVEVEQELDLGADILDLEADPIQATQALIGKILRATALENTFTAEEHVFAGPRESMGIWGDRDAETPELRAVADRTRSPELANFLESVVERISTALASRANEILSELLSDPPTAVLNVPPIAFRAALPPLSWTFATLITADHGVELTSLSRAEQYWVSAAINLALYEYQRALLPPADPLRAAIALFDEPESGLHRSAEARMADALRAQTVDPRCVLFAATHSPELLDDPAANVIEVQRGSGRRGGSHVAPLDLADRQALERLGLAPSDLLRWPRVFLLVEGVHDQTLLEVFIGERLRRARVEIIPIHGARNLAGSVDSQVLFDHTRAHVVALLDKMRGEDVRSAWVAALTLERQGDIDGALELVVSRIRDKTDESGHLVSWLTAALRRGMSDRISPAGLELADVIEYLPVQRFVSRAADWESLHEEHLAARQNPKKSVPSDFKKWLISRHHVDLSLDNLRDIAQNLNVPKEFLRLMDELEARSLNAR